MGKGDRRTRRGKISRGTHGKHNPRKEKEQTPGSTPARPPKAAEK